MREINMCHNVFGNFLYMLQKTVVHCYRIMEQSMLLGQLLLAKMSICPSIKNSKNCMMQIGNRRRALTRDDSDM